METIRINHEDDHLKKLDELGKQAMQSAKLMDLVVNGATCMSVTKDSLRGIIRVLITGAAAEVTAKEKLIATQKRALELMYCENKKYNPDGMGNPAYYLSRAQEAGQ